MTSHELATLLLSKPDLDIYFFEKCIDENKFHAIGDELMFTPSGLFMTKSNDYIHPNIKSPYEHPKIGHMQIFFKDGTITPKGEGYHRNTVLSLENGKFINIPLEKNIYLLWNNATKDDIEIAKTNYPDSNIFTENDVDYISVLTEYDSDTWHEVWEELTYNQALQFGKDLYKQMYPPKAELSQEQKDSFIVDYPDSEFDINYQNTKDLQNIIKELGLDN